MGVGAIVPYLPLYYRSLGFGLGEIGGILALGAFVGLVAAPMWGAASDRRRGSPVVLVATTVTALAGAAIIALAPDRLDRGVVIGGVAILGAGMAGFNPILDARALEAAGSDRAGYGPLRAWGSIAYIGSALGTGALIEARGLGALFVVLGVALAATAGIGLVLRPPATRHVYESVVRPMRAASRLFGPSGLGLFLLGAFLTWLGMSAVLSFTPLRFEELGAGASIIGLGGAIAAAIEVPIMLRFPAIAARFGSERLLIAGAGFLAARSVIAALATTPEILLSASIFGGMGFALFYVGGVTYVSRRVPVELAATAQGIFQGAGNSLGQVTAALGGGVIAAEAGIDGLFSVGAGLGIAATAIIALAVRSGPRQRAGQAECSGRAEGA